MSDIKRVILMACVLAIIMGILASLQVVTVSEHFFHNWFIGVLVACVYAQDTRVRKLKDKVSELENHKH